MSGSIGLPFPLVLGCAVRRRHVLRLPLLLHVRAVIVSQPAHLTEAGRGLTTKRLGPSEEQQSKGIRFASGTWNGVSDRGGSRC